MARGTSLTYSNVLIYCTVILTVLCNLMMWESVNFMDFNVIV